MQVNFKPTKLYLYIAILSACFGISYAQAEDINDGAKRLSEQKNMENFQEVKLDVQQDQLSLSDAMRDTMEKVGKLTKSSVADRQHLIVFDELGNKYSKDKVEELTKLNKLIVDYQNSEIDLMNSSANYAEAKNELSTMFETRQDVLERLHVLEQDLKQAQEIILVQSEDNRTLNNHMETLANYIDQMRQKSLEQETQDFEKEQKISNLFRSDKGSPQDIQPLELVLSGINLSKGIMKATFIGHENYVKKASEGEFVKDGWKVNYISDNRVELGNGVDTIIYTL